MFEKLKKQHVYILIATAVLIYSFIATQEGCILEPCVDNAKNNDSNEALFLAYSYHKSGVQVQGVGIVTKLLPDDLKGARHQRFILMLGSKLTVLIAHNIDIAQKISNLKEGDSVGFYGEYEWNKKGGVVHWTHRDLRGYHVAGWLQHNQKIYQ